MSGFVPFLKSKSQKFLHIPSPLSTVKTSSGNNFSNSQGIDQENPLPLAFSEKTAWDPIESVFKNLKKNEWSYVNDFLKVLPSIAKSYNWEKFSHQKFLHKELSDQFKERRIDFSIASQFPIEPLLTETESIVSHEDFFSSFFYVKELSKQLENPDLTYLITQVEMFVWRLIFCHNALYLNDPMMDTPSLQWSGRLLCKQLAKEYMWIDFPIYPKELSNKKTHFNSKIFCVKVFSIEKVALVALKYYVKEVLKRSDVGDPLLLNRKFTHMVTINRIYGRHSQQGQILINDKIQEGDLIIASLMDLVLNNEGEAYSLIQHLRNISRLNQPISLTFLQHITHDLALGINELHKEQLIHRDIKPDNILIKKGGYIIIDGDLMKRYSSHRKFSKAGTQNFVAPEVFEEDFYNEKVDLFSLGVTLFLSSELRYPYTENDFMKEDLPPPVFEKVQDRDLQDLISKLLRRDPDERGTIDDVLGHPFLTKKLD